MTQHGNDAAEAEEIQGARPGNRPCLPAASRDCEAGRLPGRRPYPGSRLTPWLQECLFCDNLFIYGFYRMCFSRCILYFMIKKVKKKNSEKIRVVLVPGSGCRQPVSVASPGSGAPRMTHSPSLLLPCTENGDRHAPSSVLAKLA